MEDGNWSALGFVQCSWFSVFFQFYVPAAFAGVSRFRRFGLELKVAAMGTLYFDSPFGIFHFLDCRRVKLRLAWRGRWATFLQLNIAAAFAAVGRLIELRL